MGVVSKYTTSSGLLMCCFQKISIPDKLLTKKSFQNVCLYQYTSLEGLTFLNKKKIGMNCFTLFSVCINFFFKSISLVILLLLEPKVD